MDKRRLQLQAPEAELFIPNIHRLKDMADQRLRREDQGPGYCRFPHDVDVAHLAELTAERKERGLWVQKRGEANETLDLFNYAYVALIRLVGSDPSLALVPTFARPSRVAPDTAPLPSEASTPAAPAAAASPRPRVLSPGVQL